VLPFSHHRAGAPRVIDVPTRPIPVIPAHLSMAAARKVAALKRIALLLVERDEQVIGTIDERALATAADETPVAAMTTSLALCLRPSMPVAYAREVFIRARVAVLPVIAGGFVLGAVARGALERTKPRASER
jgi:CBS domain-containing protein